MDLKQVRKELKALGFKVTIQTLSWGPHATIKDMKYEKSLPSIFVHGENTKEYMTLEYWRPAIEFKKSLKEDVFTSDGRKIYGLHA